MPSASKVSVSARKVLKLPEACALTSMNAVIIRPFAETEPTAKTSPGLISVSVMPALLELHRDYHARRLVKMFDAVLMPTASRKGTRRSASAKRAGRFCRPTSPRDALISTNVMSLMGHPACVA